MRTNRTTSLLACALLVLGATARADSLGPTFEQLQTLSQGDADEPIALVRLLKSKDPTGFTRYLLALETEVLARGGKRLYGGKVAQELAGGAPPVDTIAIDWFPSRRACVESMRAVDPLITSLGLESEWVIAVRPWSATFETVAGAAASVLGSYPREVAADPPPFPELEEAGSTAIAPDAAAIAAFNQSDPDVGFAMLNLNQFRAQAAPPPGDDADAGSTGEEAYERYARTALWHVMRRGGSILFAGQPIGLVAGAAGSALDQRWNQVALVFYPSRRHMRDMLADPDYRAAVPHRVAGLERAALLVTEPWPPYNPLREASTSR
ncbi:MAG TPA: DUF1330 domain-containing protein [Myxococcota bacterium]|nr:DUF1330 domain-containing protein [Myxococcota bacterium]